MIKRETIDIILSSNDRMKCDNMISAHNVIIYIIQSYIHILYIQEKYKIR